MGAKAVALLEWSIKEITMLPMAQMDPLRKCKTRATQRDRTPRFTEVEERMETQTFQRIKTELMVAMSEIMQCK